jgi:Spy/CpxP family protein refolding chaperone
MADRMGRELDLDPDQKKRIEAVFRRGAERFERFHAVTGREFEALRQELNTEIERELTPEQRARFRQLGPGPRGHHPPPPPPPPR